MNIPNNILRQHLQNVFFLTGDSCAGKSTAARALREKYGMYVYDSDAMRREHFARAQRRWQPCMTRPDADTLTPAQARAWEKDIVREMTPMMLCDLMQLAAQHESVLCEGDIDLALLCAAAPPGHVFCLFVSPSIGQREFFDRPDHANMLENIYGRADLTPAQKEAKAQRLRQIALGDTPRKTLLLPGEVARYGLPYYVRTQDGTVEEMLQAIEKAFGLV
ncbi:MAG: hypothetical protein PHD32_01225 [Eubacteriales bacterium]|nr:hypothetical protein [Eubacteriales bacterium]